jgi:hypothetical protein
LPGRGLDRPGKLTERTSLDTMVSVCAGALVSELVPA